MPTQWKIDAVEEMKGWIDQCTIAISADFTGMNVVEMSNLRKALREKGVRLRVVRNTLAYLAAEAAGRPQFKDIVEGPTGIVYSTEDSVEPARALAEFIRTNRSSLKIRAGLMGDRSLTAREVETLATLPSKEELIAKLMGQLQAPITGLVYTLNAPISGLARVLQGRVEQLPQES